jgi:hypothetical protein
VKAWLESIPKFILGPMAVILGIIYFVVQDPPRTICDEQFSIFKKENAKYLYPYEKNSIVVPPGIKRDIEACRIGNSPGGCYDWLEGIKKMVHATRNIPDKCGGSRIEELAPLKQWFDQSMFLFSQISWNNTGTIRDGLFNWLEQDDMAMFCRLKDEYIRLIGKDEWRALENSLGVGLMKLKKTPKKETWERTILSHKCRVY